MNWITKDYVKQEAAKGESQALYCSLMHHQQGRDCTRGELIDALDKDEFGADSDFCACCTCFDSCAVCPLTTQDKGKCDEICCDGAYLKVKQSIIRFTHDPYISNFGKFQKAEKAVVKYIQAVIEKEPEEVYHIGDRFKGKDAKYLLSTIADGTHRVHLANMSTGSSCNGVLHVKDAIKITPEELMHLHGIISMTRYYDARKQAKVGEKPEQGKSEVKAEPELRHLDYGLNISGEICVMGNPWDEDKLVQMDRNSIHSAAATGPTTIIKTKLGNLIDDLTETSEGFEMEQHPMQTVKVSISPTGYIHLKDLGGTICIDADQLDEFISNLRKVANGIRSKT